MFDAVVFCVTIFKLYIIGGNKGKAKAVLCDHKNKTYFWLLQAGGS